MAKKKTVDQLRKEYLKLAHGMQAGVAIMMTHDHSSTTAKSMRTGINTVMSDQGALVALLIEKGIFTEEEYYEKLIEFMGNEVKGYEKKISDRTNGANINLI